MNDTVHDVVDDSTYGSSSAGRTIILQTTNGEDAEKYLCSICRDIMKVPLLIGPCGHRTCRECAEDLLSGSPPSCPFDGSAIQKEHVVQDKVLQVLLKQLPVKCFQGGCTWSGSYLDMLIHQQKCPNRNVSCLPECGKNIPVKLLELHLNNDCPAAPFECPKCGTKVKKCQQNVHEAESCPEMLVECPNKCGMADNIPKRILDQHLKEDCSNQVTSCFFVKAGCPFEGKRSSMEDHEMENYEEHLKLVSSTIDKATEERRDTNESLKFLFSLKARAKVLSLLYEGQYFWTIADFAANFNKAQKVSHDEIKSQVFCSSKLGYRLQLSTSLYGRGTSQGDYMSMTVHMCPGEYDELLCWPFGHSVAITLLDQCDRVEKRKHLKSFVDPAKSEKSTRKDDPQVFGTETFARIKDLLLEGHYVKNDSICFLVEILD